MGTGGGGGGSAAQDKQGKTISIQGWLSTHKEGDRELVQGLKGEPTWLVTKRRREGLRHERGLHTPRLRRALRSWFGPVHLPLPRVAVRHEREGGARASSPLPCLGARHDGG